MISIFYALNMQQELDMRMMRGKSNLYALYIQQELDRRKMRGKSNLNALYMQQQLDRRMMRGKSNLQQCVKGTWRKKPSALKISDTLQD